jgi:SAM-dependent methyltransferase
MSSPDPASLLRVAADSPEYRRLAAAEAEFWQRPHPLGMEGLESTHREGPVDRHTNARFTGDPNLHWYDVVHRHGPFRRGLMLGTSLLRLESAILETNPGLHLTFLDISAGPLQRRLDILGARFPGRVDIATADLNFAELPPDTYDVVLSSSTIHHVTNLEHLAFQIDRSLVDGGWFFLEDYVGEPRFAFAAEKKRLFEVLYLRDTIRQAGRGNGLVWKDASDLSPFCGVRSSDILPVFRTFMSEVEVRTAATLTVPLMRSGPFGPPVEPPWWKVKVALLKRRLGLARTSILSEAYLNELFLVGDAAADAGLVAPGTAFATYRKRPPA